MRGSDWSQTPIQSDSFALATPVHQVTTCFHTTRKQATTFLLAFQAHSLSWAATRRFRGSGRAPTGEKRNSPWEQVVILAESLGLACRGSACGARRRSSLVEKRVKKLDLSGEIIHFFQLFCKFHSLSRLFVEKLFIGSFQGARLRQGITSLPRVRAARARRFARTCSVALSTPAY